MKNYEVKYATQEISGLELTKISNKRIAYLVPNMFGKMKSGFAKKINSMVITYQEELARKVVEEKAKVAEPTPVETTVKVEDNTSATAPKVEPVVEQTIDPEKKFYIKAKIADFELLRNNQIKVSTLPKKLLIPTKFKTSLFTNYIKNKEVVVAVETSKEATLSPAELQQQAVLEYIALNNQMKDLIKDIEEIKAKMISLAKEHGLTRSMVENAMQN